MAVVKKKTKVVGNPGKRAFGRPAARGSSRPKDRHKPRRNFGDLIGFTLGNPGKKGSMATATKKKSKANKGYAHSKKHKSNPGHKTNKGGHSHHKKHRRNPGALGEIGPAVTNALFVIVGALGSKLGAQVVLGTNNVGVVGYAGNAAAGGILWFLTEKVMKNRAASNGVIAGTLVQILLRAINDFTPFGTYLNQLGMGDYQMQSFVTPQVLVDPWNSAEIEVPPGWVPQLPAASPAAAGGNGGSAPVARRAAAPPPSSTMAAAAGVSGLGGGGLYGGGGGGGLYSL